MNYDILFVIRNSVSDKKFSKHVIVDWEKTQTFMKKSSKSGHLKIFEPILRFYTKKVLGNDDPRISCILRKSRNVRIPTIQTSLLVSLADLISHVPLPVSRLEYLLVLTPY